jgi:hypothetical protein
MVIPMSDPIARAMADLSHKEQEISRLQTEAEKLRVFIEMYRSYADVPASNGSKHGAPRSKKDMIGDAAIEVIKRHKAPVPFGSLYKEIEASGVEVGTAKPKQYLSTTLNRDSRFKSIKGEGWGLAD